MKRKLRRAGRFLGTLILFHLGVHCTADYAAFIGHTPYQPGVWPGLPGPVYGLGAALFLMTATGRLVTDVVRSAKPKADAP